MRLVLADEHRLFIEPLAGTLSRFGLTVAALATSAEELLSALACHMPDICLLGPRLTGSSGLDLPQVIATRHPTVKTVMLLGGRDAQAVPAATVSAVSAFIGRDQHVTAIVDTLTGIGTGDRPPPRQTVRGQSGGTRPTGTGGAGGARAPLTIRERQVLTLMVEGLCTKQIARSLDIALNTARAHAQNVLMKLGVHSRLEAMAVAADSGMLGLSGRQSSGQFSLIPAISGAAACPGINSR